MKTKSPTRITASRLFSSIHQLPLTFMPLNTHTWWLIWSFTTWCNNNHLERNQKKKNERACDRQQHFKKGSCYKKVLNSRTFDRHTHVQPGSSQDQYNQHSLCQISPDPHSLFSCWMERHIKGPAVPSVKGVKMVNNRKRVTLEGWRRERKARDEKMN